jgi:hypothetical protein
MFGKGLPRVAQMPSTVAEVDKLFAAGAEAVALTRAEWDAIREISKG